MSLDRSKLNVLRRAPERDSLVAGTDNDNDSSKATNAATATAAPPAPPAPPCRVCCMALGACLASAGAVPLNGMAVYMTMRARQMAHYSVNGIARQVVWLTVPTIPVGASLHWFLYEAMGSPRRSAWGEAWTKAVVVNATLWAVAVGACALLWRKGLRVCAAGRRVHARWPRPSTALFDRMQHSTRERLSGMDVAYWLWVVFSAHVSFVMCVAMCVYADRAYLFMPPAGHYAQHCLPVWRREQFATIVAPPTTTTTTATSSRGV